MTAPGHGERQTGFIPAFWYEIEKVINPDQEFGATTMGGISAEDLAYIRSGLRACLLNNHVTKPGVHHFVIFITQRA